MLNLAISWVTYYNASNYELNIYFSQVDVN